MYLRGMTTKSTYRADEASESPRTAVIEAMEGRTLMSTTALPYIETAPSDPAPATADSTVVVAKVAYSDISLVKRVDKSSPVLFNY
jgi:hypothetical protein